MKRACWAVLLGVGMMAGCEQQRHLERTEVFKPPRLECEVAYERPVPGREDELIAMDYWYDEPTKKGNTGVFYWNCGEPQ